MGAAVSGAVAAATAGPARASARSPAARSSDGPPPRPGPGPVAVPPLNVPTLRAAVGDLAHPQLTGCQLRVSGSAGRWYGTAGVADRDTGRAIHERDTFRIGSITKVFVATVVLQLAAEQRLSLETPVQQCLPGLLPAHFPPITVRQLLQHTSGLPDEQEPPYDLSTPESIARHRYDRWTPHQIVAMVSHGPMKFTPGTKQEYRGINYVLLALLIEGLTGRPYGLAIARRILRPLGLRHTSVPGHDPHLHGPHVHGYMKMTDGSLLDITAFDQSLAWGEGEMISHTGDLDRFLTALFSGELLPPRQLEQMFTLPSDEVRMLDGSPARFSAGLQTFTINGITLWGKTGERYGYSSALFATRDQQRRVVISFNPTRRDATQAQASRRIAEALTRP